MKLRNLADYMFRVQLSFLKLLIKLGIQKTKLNRT